MSGGDEARAVGEVNGLGRYDVRAPGKALALDEIGENQRLINRLDDAKTEKLIRDVA